MTTALVPGSFDPPTNGHVDVIARCAGIFDKVLVAVIENPSKSPLFSTEERIALLKETCSPYENVEFGSFAGLLVDYAEHVGVDVIVKGLRAITDFDYEIQMAQMNRNLSGIMTLFVATKPEYGYLSSSLVKEVGRYGGSIDSLVPENVATALKERFND
ncbi:MAG: pantetheine-phosphate adenylyltransferase [Acidimicrobiia bacterium]|nr:pantetheine-phosphate adenylyltransferase [Acidimicrobiia bacterium]MBT8213644.1 pantetheine-phosphate adenylyltransferase [Acidimicrobiia bacterium]NNF70336.1 pantetheine-phosphate adenylyltransferase [Acidimicrobiia bacterium]NNK91730.1 pantetheine-phosphate adenylyltransferase [Acidimicrobiia bacterium]